MMTCDIIQKMTGVTFAKWTVKKQGQEIHSKRKESCAVSQGRMVIISSNSKIKREF